MGATLRRKNDRMEGTLEEGNLEEDHLTEDYFKMDHLKKIEVFVCIFDPC